MAVQVLNRKAASPLERLVDDYLASCEARGLSPKTLTNSYGYPLRFVFLAWCEAEGIRDLPDLDGRALDRFTSSLLRRQPKGHPISKHTVHSYVRPVRQLMTWASRVGEEVLAKPQLPRCQKPVRDVLTMDDIDLMENVMSVERDKLIIRLFGDCGLRLGELTAVQPGDLRRSGRQAHLRILGKGARVRDVPVPPQLVRRLERLIDGRPPDRSTDHVFLTVRRTPFGDYEPLTGNGVYQVVKDAAARARISIKVHPHLLRHSWMTEMLRRGMNPIQLSVVAGASLKVIMDHYTHLTKEDSYEAMIKALAAPRGVPKY